MTDAVGSVGEALERARQAERDGALDQALEEYRRALDRAPSEPPEVRADLWRWMGTVHRSRHDLGAAREAYDASLALAEEAGDATRIAAALNCMGILEQAIGSLDAAALLYRRARALVDHTDDPLVPMLDQNLATLASIRGDPEGALESYRSALERLLALGRTDAAAMVLNNMGMANLDRAAWSEARTCFDRAYQLADQLRDATLLAGVDLNRAELELREGRPREAREMCDRAFEAYGRLGSVIGRGEALKLYGMIAREDGKLYLAASHFRAALDLATQGGDPLLEAETEAERAILHLEQEENREALRSLNRAHKLFSELQARRELFDLDRRLDRLESTYLDVVARWGASIEAKDAYTAGHCERVASYACMIAAGAGFSGRDLTWFRMGGFLHDVGKTAVPEAVLNKPGKLSDDEWAVMKSHTTVGDEIVRDLNFPWDIAPLVRSHHERWDGTGYPDGLAGEAIPLPARILCIADVYDALTTARSYRAALDHDEAMGIMERDQGAFDPRLFGLFRSLIQARHAEGRAHWRAPQTRAAAG